MKETIPYIFAKKIYQFFISKFIRPFFKLELPLDRPTERTVEYPFVFENLPKRKCKILDVGCSGSTLPMQLAALGHKVFGIDIRPWPVRYKNVKIIQGDIRKLQFSNNFFDLITAISTIEHVGIREYIDFKMEDPSGDIKAVREMMRVLKPGGKMIITLPYGIPPRKPQHRYYSSKSLKELLTGLKADVCKFYAFKNGCWARVSKREAERTKSSEFAKAVVLLVVSKIK